MGENTSDPTILQRQAQTRLKNHPCLSTLTLPMDDGYTEDECTIAIVKQ